jgi:hypothetical protein
MKKLILILLISFVLIFGCTQTSDDNLDNISVKENSNGTIEVTWSERVAQLGEPTYESIEIESGYKILPFPGLTYNGYRDGWQAFYASNSDLTFAIYASPEVITNAGTYEEVKQSVIDEYLPYDSTIQCNDISTSNWITKANAFSCIYIYGESITFNVVGIYKDGSYIKTDLSVWGTDLGDYQYIFDEFNQKAVSWK